MKTVLLYAVVVLIWGSTWFAIKLQLGAVPSQVSVAYRFALAALLLFAWCWVRRLRMKFTLRAHLWLILQGVTVFSTNYALFYEAEKHLVSGSVGIIFAHIPPLQQVSHQRPGVLMRNFLQPASCRARP